MAGKTFRLPPLTPKAPVFKPFTSGSAGSDVSNKSDIISFDVTGLVALENALRGMPKVFRDAAGYEMAEIAHEVIEDARENYVPLKWGPLKESGNADEYDPNTNSNITEIAMWFGAPGGGGNIGPASSSKHSLAAQTFRTLKGEGIHEHADPSEYALEQHENLSYQHTPPPDLTGPKYLEKPLMKVQGTIAPRIANRIGLAMGTGNTVVVPGTASE